MRYELSYGIELTTESAASSYGLPILIVSGAVLPVSIIGELTAAAVVRAP